MLHLRAPAPAVIEVTNIAGRPSMLDAFSYKKDAPAPDCVKKAPFNIKSPSDLQFHFLHSLFDERKCLVT